VRLVFLLPPVASSRAERANAAAFLSARFQRFTAAFTVSSSIPGHFFGQREAI
jgi:hypothetical protein